MEVPDLEVVAQVLGVLPSSEASAEVMLYPEMERYWSEMIASYRVSKCFKCTIMGQIKPGSVKATN
jgi:hypothetical protein